MMFIESVSFTKTVYKYLNEDEYKNLQMKLIDRPSSGDVIPGCGGIRKIRWAEKPKSRGKRGGVRVFYLSLEETRHIHLLAILEKTKKDDLSFDEKKILKELAARLKQSARTKRSP